VDAFIAASELALFVAMLDGWRARTRVFSWTVALGGLAVSVGGNIGHVASTQLSTRATAAVPPLAAFAALAVGLGVLKRVVANRRALAVATPTTAVVAVAEAVPSTTTAPQSDAVPPEVPADAEHAALIAMRATQRGGQSAVRSAT
jgi:hypothetical protein